MPELFTIGHSNHSWNEFLELLLRHQINAVADVRSSPYSSRFPQFNLEPLKAGLRDAGIKYNPLGEQLGARRSERECYVDGVALYSRIATTPAFQAGLERVIHGVKSYRPVLMCAEKDPLECHRTILICRHLRDVATIHHILADGSLEGHGAAEARLMTEEHIPSDDLFVSRAQLLARAYDQRGEKIAFHEPAERVQAA